MARYNQVLLLGAVVSQPKTAVDENGEIDKISVSTAVMRSQRNSVEYSTKQVWDIPLVMSVKRRIIESMRSLTVGSVVFIEGTLCTVNYDAVVRCPVCNTPITEPTTIAFVNPIYVREIVHYKTKEQAMKFIESQQAISNRCTLIGTCRFEPAWHVTSSGLGICNYQMFVKRAIRIREEEDRNKYDFPFIKSYGSCASDDHDYVKAGTTVFVDGFLQTRDYTKEKECPNCGEKIKLRRMVTEVVPHSSEYFGKSLRVIPGD